VATHDSAQITICVPYLASAEEPPAAPNDGSGRLLAFSVGDGGRNISCAGAAAHYSLAVNWR